MSDCVLEASSGAPAATDVPVSPSSCVVVMSEALLSDFDWEIVEPQSFSFSRKRRAVGVENQEKMSYEGTLVNAPAASRRKIMPPQQSLQSSIEAMQLQTEVEDQESGSYETEFEGEHRWTARDETVGAVPER